MVRSIIAIAILFLATFLLPFWVQAILYVIAIFFVRHKILLLFPALFADAWYAPTRALSFGNNKTFLIVLGVIVLYFFIIKNTRITQKYGLPKA